MNTDIYFAIYNYLVLDRHIDTDEAQCILNDIAEATELDTDLCEWEYLEDIL